jgi:hypothetical protein
LTARDHRRLPQELLKTSSGALNSGRAVLADMRDSYETPEEHRPWQAPRTDWAASGPRQDHPSQPATPPADAQARPPRWSGLGLSQDPVQPPGPATAPGPGPAGWPAPDPNSRRFPGDSDPAGLRPADWTAQDSYPNHQGGGAAHPGALEHRPVNWVEHDPYRHHPVVPPQPSYPAQPSYPPQPSYPAHAVPIWRQGWADYDPYTGYPMWPGHSAYADRNAGLRRLSKMTWRAAEVSAIVAVGFVALFARTAHSAVKNVSAQHSGKASIHAAAHPAHKQHKPKHHHRRHHHASVPGLAPPAAPPAAAPAAPAPPPAAPAAPAPAAPAPPPPPPPPVTTSGGSGGGG